MHSRAFFLPILLATFVGSCETALAQDQFGVRQRFDIQFGFGNLANPKEIAPYLPMLQRAMTAELHFAKKICDPNSEQFDELHRAGLSAVLYVANTYADAQRRRKKMDAWPDPNEAIATQLSKAVSRIMPAEVAETYQAEIAGRFRAHRDADAALLVNLIDQHTLLDPDRQAALFTTLRDNRKSHWATASMLLNYPQYAALPEPDVLRPHLSELQQRLWSYRPKQRRVTLSWQIHFGINNSFATIGLEEFDEPGPLDAELRNAEEAKP
jgi:hypothetical protein